MTDPISYTSSSARFGLPFLFAAQAQKDFFINEALARIDALLHLSVEAESAVPPADAIEGQCWIIQSGATGDWSGKDGQIACWQSGGWLYHEPQPGMRAFDNSSGQNYYFNGAWAHAAMVTSPSGGATQDAEARSAIAELTAALVAAGILA